MLITVPLRQIHLLSKHQSRTQNTLNLLPENIKAAFFSPHFHFNNQLMCAAPKQNLLQSATLTFNRVSVRGLGAEHDSF